MPTTKTDVADGMVKKVVKKKKTARVTKNANGRSVKYPKLSVVLYGDSSLSVDGVPHKPAITAQLAREWLGWEEETPSTTFGSNYLLKFGDRKIRCSNNNSNRPFRNALYEKYKQEHLRNNWKVNGETIIIGQTGEVISGQHTLIGLIGASEEYLSNPSKYVEYWKTEPTLSKFVTFGIVEDDEVVNTIDTGKERGLDDVIYRQHLFPGLNPKNQQVCARMAKKAVQMLWDRTKAKNDAWGLRHTMGEYTKFLEDHIRLLQCVTHIWEEDSEGKIKQYTNPGNAAGLLYLMGCSTTEKMTYYGADHPNESLLDWSNWDKACEFWVKLAQNAESMVSVKHAYAQRGEQGPISSRERWGMLINAWMFYEQGEKFTPEDIMVLTDFDEVSNTRNIIDHPSIGGIDLADESLTTEVEIEERKQEVKKRKQKQAKKVNKPMQKISKIAKRAGKEWAKGDKAWVHPPGDDSYFAILVDDPFEAEDGTVSCEITEPGSETIWVEDTSRFSLDALRNPLKTGI